MVSGLGAAIKLRQATFPFLVPDPVIPAADEYQRKLSFEITEALAAHDRAHPDSPAAPFAINQIVHRSNDRLEHDMQVCAKYKVPIIITSLGAREDVNQAVHAWGGVVLHDVISNVFARKAIGRSERSVALGTGEAADHQWHSHFAQQLSGVPVDVFVERSFRYLSEQHDSPARITERFFRAGFCCAYS